MKAVNSTQSSHPQVAAQERPAPALDKGLRRVLIATENPLGGEGLPRRMAAGSPSNQRPAPVVESSPTLPAQTRELLQRISDYFSWKTAANEFIAELTQDPRGNTRRDELEKDLLIYSVARTLTEAGVDPTDLAAAIKGLVEKMRSASPALDYTKVMQGLVNKIQQSHNTPQQVIEQFSLKSYVRAACHQLGPSCQPWGRQDAMVAALYLFAPCLTNQTYSVGTHEQRFFEALAQASTQPTVANEQMVRDRYPAFHEAVSQFTPMLPFTPLATTTIEQQEREIVQARIEEIPNTRWKPRQISHLVPALSTQPLEDDCSAARGRTFSNLPHAHAGALTNQGRSIRIANHLTPAFGFSGANAAPSSSNDHINIPIEGEDQTLLQPASDVAQVLLAAVPARVVQRSRLTAAAAVGFAAITGALYAGYRYLSPHAAPPAQRSIVPVSDREQEILAFLQQAPHVQDNGAWTSSLDALRALLAQTPEPSRIEAAAALLDVDLGRDCALVAQQAPAGATRQRRSVTDEAAEVIIPGLGVVTVSEVVIAVQHDQQRAQLEDQLFVNLQQYWRNDPEMHWLESQPQSEQKLWISYAAACLASNRALSDALPTPAGLWLERAQDYWAQQGLPGHPYEYEVSFNSSVHAGQLQVPITTHLSLLEASRLEPWLEITNVTVWRDGQVLTASRQDSVMDFQRGAGAWQPLLAEVTARHTTQRAQLQALYSRSLEAELHRDVLEARFKGELSGHGAYLDGERIVLDALRNEPGVRTGLLSLSKGTGRQAVSVNLTNWLVFERAGVQGESAGVVLYRPDIHTWQAYNTRQELFQDLDQRRLQQRLLGELTVTTQSSFGVLLREEALALAAPEDRATLRQFFQQIADKPAVWSEASLTFTPYAKGDFAHNIAQWASDKLAVNDRQLREQKQSPSLAARQAEAVAIAAQSDAFRVEHLPPLREFNRRQESAKLTRFVHQQNPQANQTRVDSDTVFIDYNNRKMTLTDWVEQYRGHGDMPFDFSSTNVTSNNFQKYATLTAADPALQALLNTPAVKQSVEANLRATYAGDDYIAHVRALLDPNTEHYAMFQQLRVAEQIAGLRVAVQMAHDNKELAPDQSLWLKGLVDRLPGSLAGTKEEVGELSIRGTRIPGMWVLSRRYQGAPVRQAEARRESFVYMASAPWGKSLWKLDANFIAWLRTEPLREAVEQRVLTEDRTLIDEAFKSMSSNSFRTAVRPLSHFAVACDQLILDIIDNTAETTTSKAEVIQNEILKGARYAASGACLISTAGIGAAPCALLTLPLMANDIRNVVQLTRRGETGEALLESAFLWADTLDVMPGFKAALAVGKASLGMRSVRRYAEGLTPGGRPNTLFSRHDLNPTDLSKTNAPRAELGGAFYRRAGSDKWYVIDRELGQQWVFEVYSDNGWRTMRIRDPQRPLGQGMPIVWRDGSWQFDPGGLMGGAPTVEQYLRRPGMSESEYNVMREHFEKDVNDFFSKPHTSGSTELPSISASETLETFFDKIYSTHKGVVIGEQHREMDTVVLYTTLKKMMGNLKKNGVKVLYVEIPVDSREGRDILEAWPDGRVNAGFTPGRGSDITRVAMMNEAHAQGIRTNPADSLLAMGINFDLSESIGPLADNLDQGIWKAQRLRLFNYLATLQIQSLGPDEKWLMVVGKAHVKTLEGVPGVAELNGAVGIDFEIGHSLYAPTISGATRHGDFKLSASDRYQSNWDAD